jgi:hypothetical protein
MKHEYHEGKETVEKMMTQLFRAPKSIAYRFGWPLDFFCSGHFMLPPSI